MRKYGEDVRGVTDIPWRATSAVHEERELSARCCAIRHGVALGEMLAEENAAEANAAGHACVRAEDRAEHPTCEDRPRGIDRLECNAW